MICKVCGKEAFGPCGDPTIPRGWFSKYYSYGDSIYGCSEKCLTIGKDRKMSKQEPSTEPERQNVILAFKIDEAGDTVNLLDSYGGVRVFTYPDGIDPRIGPVESIPLKQSWMEAEKYLLEEPNSHRPVFIPYDIAKRVFSQQSFADFTLDGLK